MHTPGRRRFMEEGTVDCSAAVRYIMKMNCAARLLALGLFIVASGEAQQEKATSAFAIARLKYAGGGDWYNDPSADVNLLTFIRRTTGIDTDPRYRFVDLAGDDIFTSPFLFLTGHGNIVLSEAEVRRLRTYLENGGFLYADDDYGLDKAFRREIHKVFPQQDLV